jgi:hypothetical protein
VQLFHDLVAQVCRRKNTRARAQAKNDESRLGAALKRNMKHTPVVRDRRVYFRGC